MGLWELSFSPLFKITGKFLRWEDIGFLQCLFPIIREKDEKKQ